MTRLVALAAALAALAFSNPAQAQSGGYPNRFVKIVVLAQNL